MNGRARQLTLIIVMGVFPAVLLFLSVWTYNSIFERMRLSLHEQRSLALRNLAAEGGHSQPRPYAVAFLRRGTTEINDVSGDWPKNFDPMTIFGLRASLGSATEFGVEIDQGASGPVLLWILPVEDGFRLALQTRRTFYARLESFRIIMWTVALLLAGGGFILFTSMARKLSDVFTEMEIKNQELERANRNLEELGTLKSNFLALVSHELRTPLARLVGQIKLIRQNQDRLPEEFRKRFGEMETEIEELNRMTKNALDLTRLQSEDLAARMELGQIGKLVQNGVERLQRIAASRGLKIDVETPETPPVSHDPYLLERILDNILVNAIKYSNENTVIAVRLVEQDSFLNIRVENTGPVISSADREKIFEKFYRADVSTEIPGTGLGLYLVRQFILMMNGKVWVEPLESGNRFVITLPW